MRKYQHLIDEFNSMTRLPIMEFKTNKGFIVVNINAIHHHPFHCGLTFEIEADMEYIPYFSGEVLKYQGNYFIRFNEFETKLYSYLDKIHDEVTEGIMMPNGLEQSD